MTLYSLNDIKRSIPSPYYERGLAYQQQQRVAEVTIDPRGNKIMGQVQGSDETPYRVLVYIQSRPRGSGLLIHGNCTCPMGGGCKHVVAVLVHALKSNSAPGPAKPALPVIPPEDRVLQEWLTHMERALDAPPAQIEIPERLFYLLSWDRYARAARVRVDFVVARKLKHGEYGKEQRFSGDPSSSARYVTPTDQRLLRWIRAIQPFLGGTLLLEGSDAPQVLREIIATGRCHWEEHTTAPLALGDTRNARLEWEAADDGTQRLRCVGEHIDAVLPFEPPWYLDLASHVCGPLHTGLPDRLTLSLLNAPALSAEQATVAHAKLSEHVAQHPMPLPHTFRKVINEHVTPVPSLHLFTAKIPLRGNYRWQQGADFANLELARLSFTYAGLSVEAEDKRPVLTRVTDDKMMCFPRNPSLESDARRILDDWGFVALSLLPMFKAPAQHAHAISLFDNTGTESLIEFSLHGVPELRAQGWKVTMADDYPYRLVEEEVGWYADVNEEPGHDWFDVELGITIDGNRISLLPILINMVRSVPDQFDIALLKEVKDKVILVRLEDGRLLPMPVERVLPILSILVELYDTNTALAKHVRLPTAQAGQLAELEAALDTRVEWNGGERLRELGKRLRDFQGIRTVEPPASLQAQLRGYQQQGLNWLQFLREYQMGGVLADDMGLGKTVQTLAHLLAEKDSGRMNLPSLVIAPTSLMVNWRMEAQRFAPSLRVLVLHGSERKQSFDNVAQFDLVLTTYPLLPRDFAMLGKHEYHLLILDEAQNIKNPKSKASQLVRQLQARHRLCLTGTPMENHLGELWSLFDFLMPGLLGDEARFRRLFRNPIEKHADRERQQSLNRRIAPFMLRRTKQQVVTELPPKTEMLRSVELGGAQRDLYESIRLAMHEKVQREISKKGMARSHIIILEALLKLRQVCCDPRLLKLEAAKNIKQSAKLESLMDMLPELIEEGRRVLLFSQFTSMLALIEKELHTAKLDYVKLTGDTKDRATPVQRFQNGEVPLFLISLKAGGTGLNLTAADTVIHYDPWWNPAVENQATDRAHRIGQDKPVFVYKLLTTGTVEEKILGMQARKQELADSLFSADGAGTKALTQNDLDALFEPLG